MSAVKYNFELNQGETFDTVFTVLQQDRRPFDLTGYFARAQLRKTATDTTIQVEFITVIVDPTAGKIRLYLTADQTAALDFTKAVYDVEIENVASGTVIRVVQGVVTLSREVTR